MPMRHAAARAVLAAAFTITLAAAPAGARAAPPLPALRADANRVSVSGLSSGAYMALQYQVAYSASVVGVGVIAGGPYYCAAGSVANTDLCRGLVPNMVPDSGRLVAAAQGFAASGQIDPLANLQRARIYLFSGTKDTLVRQSAVDATWSFFWLVGVPVTNIVYVADVPAGHAFVTPSAGNACDANAAPFISHCTVGQSGYDQAGALLDAIYGPLAPPAATRDRVRPARVRAGVERTRGARLRVCAAHVRRECRLQGARRVSRLPAVRRRRARHDDVR
ncbi:polyhydroxybutyrate depolymerase [Burkholderia pseudomallei]|nr:polyhydroxybutyrate depolymerase [Burkholderia pseudomallei]